MSILMMKQHEEATRTSVVHDQAQWAYRYTHWHETRWRATRTISSQANCGLGCAHVIKMYRRMWQMKNITVDEFISVSNVGMWATTKFYSNEASAERHFETSNLPFKFVKASSSNLQVHEITVQLILWAFQVNRTRFSMRLMRGDPSSLR